MADMGAGRGRTSGRDVLTESALGRRVSRRGLLIGAAVAGGAAAWRCGGEGQTRPPDLPVYRSAPTTGPEEPQRGGILVTGTTVPPTFGVDPHIEVATGLSIFPRLYGYLLHNDFRTDTIVLDHAETVEQPDDLTYIIKLRPGIRFHDLAPIRGREVDAEDAAFSHYRYRDNPLVTSKTWHATVMESITAADRYTVVVKTKFPYAYTYDALGGISSGVIIPKELLPENLTAKAVGSGPFQLQHLDNNRQIDIVRFPGYFQPDIPYLDGMSWKIFNTDDERLRAFRERAIHMMSNRDKVEAAQVLQEFGDQVETYGTPSLSYVSLGMRVDQAPFHDERVRQAIDFGLDRERLINELTFGDGRTLGPVNPHLADGFWSLPDSELDAAYRWGQDPAVRLADARRLIERAGAAGAKIVVQSSNLPPVVDIASRVVAQLNDLGFKAEHQALELFQWFINLRTGNFHATLITHTPYESPDIPTRFYHSGGVSGIGNWFGFKDDVIDWLVTRSWGEFDRETRRATLLDAQRTMLARHGPLIQLYTGVAYSSAWRFVRGREPGLPGSLAQYNYHQWLAET